MLIGAFLISLTHNGVVLFLSEARGKAPIPSNKIPNVNLVIVINSYTKNTKIDTPIMECLNSYY